MTFLEQHKNRYPSLKGSLQEREEDTVYTHYPKVYFAFLDVLGFKYDYEVWERQKEKRSEDAPDRKYTEVFSYYFLLMQAARFMQQRDELHYAGQTSDSLYFYTNRIDYLVDFVKIFSVFNKFAMSQEFFFRGGIAQGQLFMKKHYQFYGDGVIRAYLLESEIARKPFIYIDEKTNEDLHNYLIKSNAKIYDDIVGSDGNRYFIRPFNSFTNSNIKDCLQADTDISLKDIDLVRICEILKLKKALFEYQPNTFTKYCDLLDEYNNSNK